MNIKWNFLIIAFTILLPGCYTGSQFNIEATDLEQPVSFSDMIHNDELQVVGPGDYTELSKFSISFTGSSFGSPISPNPTKDISKLLNEVVKQKGGNGITRLSINVENNTVNFLSMILRGISYTCLVAGITILWSKEPHKLLSVELVAGSIAGILFLPTLADFTIEGTVVRIEKKKN